MNDEQRIYELAAALLILARWYEGDTGSEGSLDKVRGYLETFPTGQRVLQEDREGKLDPGLLTG